MTYTRQRRAKERLRGVAEPLFADETLRARVAQLEAALSAAIETMQGWDAQIENEWGSGDSGEAPEITAARAVLGANQGEPPTES